MTPSMIQAIQAFKITYVEALRNRPEDILTVEQTDEMIHQARSELGAFSMASTIEGAVRVGLERDRCCPCGGRLVLHHRPALKVHSMQGEHDARGVSYRCDRCGQTVRPVHEQLGIESYSKTTRLFDELSSDFFLDKGATTAVQRLQRHHGIEPGRTTVLTHAERRGKQARDHRGWSAGLRWVSRILPGPTCSAAANPCCRLVRSLQNGSSATDPRKKGESIGWFGEDSA